MPSYRSIGGRPNTSGVERINRDGQMEKLQMGQAEVTPKERISWYNKAGLDPRGSLPEEIYVVEKDKVGNQMNVDDDERTRLPRPHQYSTESRLSDSRGEKLQFHKSIGSEDRAYGVTPGMVFTSGDTRNAVVERKEKAVSVAEKLVEKRDSKQSFDGNNSNYPPRDINVRKAYAAAFSKVARVMSTESHLDTETVLNISSACRIPIEDVILLEKVATKNKGLAQRYQKANVPGVEPVDPTKPADTNVVHVSDEGTDKDGNIIDKKILQDAAKDAGLV